SAYAAMMRAARAARPSLPATTPRRAAAASAPTRAALAMPAKPTFTYAAPAAANAKAARSIAASSVASPMAAVTGRAVPTVARISCSTPSETAPSAPVRGSFASMKSAPPATAADASAAFATLTSNRMAATVSSGFMFAAPLEGRSVLVTGGSSGIGQAIALAAARAGADVAITYRANAAGADQVQHAIRALGRKAAAIHLDLADAASVAKVSSASRGALGRLDVWINNAGADILTGPNATLDRIEKLDRLIAVDLRGTVLASW